MCSSFYGIDIVPQCVVLNGEKILKEVVAAELCTQGENSQVTVLQSLENLRLCMQMRVGKHY